MSTSLIRRGFDLGNTPELSQQNDPIENWNLGMPVLRQGICSKAISEYRAQITVTEGLVKNILDEQSLDDLLAQAPFDERLGKRFQSLGSTFNEGDDQEIEMVAFDALGNDEIIAEDLWLKASWLSFYEEDPSLRFRFSFGMDFEEDVAADPFRQQLAAKLCDTVFPESKIISDNQDLLKLITEVTSIAQPNFVERILYFNGPNGGAYLHHDIERGHAGVVYAQVTGVTYWLALSMEQVLDQVTDYVNKYSSELEQGEYLAKLVENREQLQHELNSFANDSLIALINESSEFTQTLIDQGYGRKLNAGDVILLPQSQHNCCWHSVFCLGQEMGQALSFAIR